MCNAAIAPADLNRSFTINQWGIAASLAIPYELGAAGVVVWVDDEEIHHITQLKSVLTNATGPIGERLLSEIAECSRVNCSNHGRCQPLRVPQPLMSRAERRRLEREQQRWRNA